MNYYSEDNLLNDSKMIDIAITAHRVEKLINEKIQVLPNLNSYFSLEKNAPNNKF